MKQVSTKKKTSPSPKATNPYDKFSIEFSSVENENTGGILDSEVAGNHSGLYL